jgi:hypothetical protein
MKTTRNENEDGCNDGGRQMTKQSDVVTPSESLHDLYFLERRSVHVSSSSGGMMRV